MISRSVCNGQDEVDMVRNPDAIKLFIDRNVDMPAFFQKHKVNPGI